VASDPQNPDGRVLILGASGMLGRRIMERFGPGGIVATYHASAFEGGVRFDAATMRLRTSILPACPGIGAALILLGITRLDACARDPAGTARVNVDAVKAVIDDLVEAGIKPVFASSDAVFDGTRGLWSEADAPHPILAYGRQKLEVERYLQSKPGPWVIARLAKVLSHRDEPRNLLSEWSGLIERRETIRCATDARFSPIDDRDAADAMIGLARGSARGIFHVAGPRPLARIELLESFIGALRLPRGAGPAVERCRLADIGFAEPRPADLSMTCARLRAELGLSLRDPETVCAEFAHARRTGANVACR
jgi:dTDP-4-dehydrorhamnose reductase